MTVWQISDKCYFAGYRDNAKEGELGVQYPYMERLEVFLRDMEERNSENEDGA